MPIYEYQCRGCGHHLEKLQRISDAPLQDCPECEAPELRRLVSAAGFRLKGSGWYETDFKQGQKRNLHDGGKSEPTGTKSAGSGTSDSKAASKSSSASSGS